MIQQKLKPEDGVVQHFILSFNSYTLWGNTDLIKIFRHYRVLSFGITSRDSRWTSPPRSPQSWNYCFSGWRRCGMGSGRWRELRRIWIIRIWYKRKSTINQSIPSTHDLVTLVSGEGADAVWEPDGRIPYQTGQEPLVFNQRIKHFGWNKWLQGISMRSSPTS